MLRLAAVKCRSEAKPEGAEASTAFVAARSCTSALDSGSRRKRRCLTREKHGKKNQQSAQRLRARAVMGVFFLSVFIPAIEGGAGQEMFNQSVRSIFLCGSVDAESRGMNFASSEKKPMIVATMTGEPPALSASAATAEQAGGGGTRETAFGYTH